MKLIYNYILLSLMLSSCSSDVIFDQKKDIKIPWPYGEITEFEYEIKDTTRAYDLTITIEHASGFSFENLYLNTSTVFPDGKSTTNPVSFQLADESGNWYGECRGEKCTINIEMATRVYFKEPGKYKLSFEQFSRTDKLEGIYSIRLCVQSSK